MNKAIETFVQLKRLAIVGVSRSGTKFGNSIYKELKERGYEVFIVHPEAKEIGGEPCYPSLEAVKSKADGVVICVPPQKAEKALREAANAGFTNIWLQQGAQSNETRALAKQLNVTLVDGKCILMYAQPVHGFHNFHRGLVKLFGGL